MAIPALGGVLGAGVVNGQPQQPAAGSSQPVSAAQAEWNAHGNVGNAPPNVGGVQLSGRPGTAGSPVGPNDASYWNSPFITDPNTGQTGVGSNPKTPVLTSMSPYADYAGFNAAAQNLGAGAAATFQGPTGQQAQASVNLLGAGALGKLGAQRDAQSALATLDQGAEGGASLQQYAGQANEMAGQSAAGQNAGQQQFNAALDPAMASAFGQSTGQQYANYANEGLGNFGAGAAQPQQDAASANAGLTPFAQGATANQQVNQQANAGLGAYGAGTTGLQDYARGAADPLGMQFAKGATGGQQQNQGSIGLLTQAAQGQTPSAAELQMTAGGEQAIAQQMAVANSARGEFGLANAQRQALQQGATLQQQNIQQQGVVRAGEMAQARGALQGATSANVGQQLQAQQAYGSLAQQAAQTGAGAQSAYAGATQATSAQEQQAQGMYAQNAQAASQEASQAEQAYAGNAYTGAGQQIQAQNNVLGATNTAAGIQATAGSNYAQDALGLANNQQQYAAGSAQGNVASAGQQLGAAAVSNQAAMAQQNQLIDFYMKQQGYSLAQATQAANLATAQGNLDIGQQAQSTAAQQVSNQQTQAYMGAGLSAAGALFAMSDERVKTGISDASDPGADRLDRQNPWGNTMDFDPHANYAQTATPASEEDRGRLIRDNPYGSDAAPTSSAYAQKAKKAGRGLMGAGAAMMQSQPVNIPQWTPSTPNLDAHSADLTSDVREKTGVRDEHSPVMAQLDAFAPKLFHYANPQYAPNPQAANERHLGVIAQDVERGPAGRTLVEHDPSGLLRLNTPAMVGTLAAGAGALKRRTDEHDKRLRALEEHFGGRIA